LPDPLFPVELVELVEKDLGYLASAAEHLDADVPTTGAARLVFAGAMDAGHADENIRAVSLGSAAVEPQVGGAEHPLSALDLQDEVDGDGPRPDLASPVEHPADAGCQVGLVWRDERPGARRVGGTGCRGGPHSVLDAPAVRDGYLVRVRAPDAPAGHEDEQSVARIVGALPEGEARHGRRNHVRTLPKVRAGTTIPGAPAIRSTSPIPGTGRAGVVRRVEGPRGAAASPRGQGAPDDGTSDDPEGGAPATPHAGVQRAR
jgi:hypothetical protein